jgi:hypothetical protein
LQVKIKDKDFFEDNKFLEITRLWVDLAKSEESALKESLI